MNNFNESTNSPVRKSPQPAKYLLFLFGGAAFFLAGTVVGANTVLKSPSSPFVQIVNKSLGQPGDINFDIFWDVYERVKNNFPQDVNNQNWVYGAAKGAVASLGDRYSLFLTPEESKKFFEDINNEFSGIGAELSQEGNLFIIVAPLKGSPAEIAGLKPQDVIVAVNGVEVSKYQFNELINVIRGEKGTQVTLKIMRKGFDEPKDFKVTRDIIQVESLEFEMKPNNHGYIRVTQFSDDTTEEFAKAIEQLLGDGAKDLVIDLRNNPGGFLNTSIDMASLFIAEGPIVSEVKKGDETKDFKPTLDDKYKDLKMVVLVNGGSASASEIFAGAIQDREKGKVIGTQTFGKGSVQEIENLKDGSALRITVAKWKTPKGRFINGEGIKPDIIVEDDEKTDADEQLDRAIKELEK